MSKADAGRKGGEATLDNHGQKVCWFCGSLLPTSFYAEIGQLGGRVTAEKYGREHMRQIALKGGRKRKGG